MCIFWIQEEQEEERLQTMLDSGLMEDRISSFTTEESMELYRSMILKVCPISTDFLSCATNMHS